MAVFIETLPVPLLGLRSFFCRITLINHLYFVYKAEYSLTMGRFTRLGKGKKPKAAKGAKVPPKALPVTLLSGFLVRRSCIAYF